jgi:hypothetical protein
MVAFNPNFRIPSAESSLVPPVDLAERVRHYLAQHPELGRERFLLEAIQREIDFREKRETANGAWHTRLEGEGIKKWSSARPPLCAEDIRLHAWLSGRLAILNYERHGLWPRFRRFLLGNRLTRWIVDLRK